jgi:predicted pyridoxine 5'-phosphate oxidase superfamily flavin-nucleotide-binding protein
MSHRFFDIAFTPRVTALQERHGSRAQYARMQVHGRPGDALGAREAALLAQVDSFFLATVSESGWPYVQHRGGPPGFVHVLSPTRIAFGDFRGNRQYVSVGNAAGDDRASLIFVDHPRRLRLKLFGHLRFINLGDADPMLAQCASLPGYEATVERIARIDIVAFDWNCPQHIPPR